MGRIQIWGPPTVSTVRLLGSIKELPNDRFGTPLEIYWDDAYLNAQVGGHARGTYAIKIVGPILFIRNWVPARYLQPGILFDFTDPNNDASKQLFNEVVGGLSQALSRYVNDPGKGNRITQIQQDSAGFARALAEVVENNHAWRANRGIEIVSTSVLGIEYNERTRNLLDTVQRADALMGARGNSNMQASVAAGLQEPGESGEGAGGMFGLAIAAGMMGVGGLQQNAQSASTNQQAETTVSKENETVQSFEKLKNLYESELITLQEYEAAKAKLLGI